MDVCPLRTTGMRDRYRCKRYQDTLASEPDVTLKQAH
jgi:hypothetical protein